MKENNDAFTIKRYVGIGGFIVSAVVLALIMRFTIAYLGDITKTADNTLNVGYGDVSIVEQFSEPSKLSMTNDITKKIQIQNKSTVPAFVRVYAEFSDSDLAAKAKVKYNNTEYSWAEFKTKLSNNGIQSKWRYVPENATGNLAGLGGYFYYTESLAATTYGTNNDPIYAQTDELFDSVTIDYNKYVVDPNDDTKSIPADSNIDRIQPLEMIVYSELVQTVETGTTTVGTDENAQTVYGYNYDKTSPTNDEWEKAWRSFLKLPATT